MGWKIEKGGFQMACEAGRVSKGRAPHPVPQHLAKMTQTGEISRLRNRESYVFARSRGGPFAQSDAVQHREAGALQMTPARQRHNGCAHPQGVAGCREPGKRKRIQSDIHLVPDIQIILQRSSAQKTRSM